MAMNKNAFTNKVLWVFFLSCFIVLATPKYFFWVELMASSGISAAMG